MRKIAKLIGAMTHTFLSFSCHFPCSVQSVLAAGSKILSVSPVVNSHLQQDYELKYTGIFLQVD